MMPQKQFPSEFFEYLASRVAEGCDSDRLPSLSQLSDELGISVARLREQLEVIKALGLVEVRPRTGIRCLPYSFFPAIWQSLSYAISVDHDYFEAFSDLRKQLERAYWEQAISSLTPEDMAYLDNLMTQAWEKLRGSPVRIPHHEHRELHLCIYRRLGNPFVLGIMEAYWEAYEAVGLSLYTDFDYYEQVWTHHQIMIDAIKQGDYQASYQALDSHFELLRQRPGV